MFHGAFAKPPQGDGFAQGMIQEITVQSVVENYGAIGQVLPRFISF
jgi:hypothetical protein